MIVLCSAFHCQRLYQKPVQLHSRVNVFRGLMKQFSEGLSADPSDLDGLWGPPHPEITVFI